MHENVDFLVIGAGLAGCTCAYLLRRGGASVLLVERQDARAKEKLCAGLLTPRAMRVLQGIFGDEAEKLFETRFASMRFSIDGSCVGIDGIEMASVRRRMLDGFVLDRYLEQGGHLLDSTSLRHLDTKRHEAWGMTRAGERFTCSFGQAIAADGAHSATRTLLCGRAPRSVAMLETEVDACGLSLTMHYTSAYKGYCWYAPVGTRAKLGCACYGDAKQLDGQLRGFADSLDIAYETRACALAPTGDDIVLEAQGCSFIGDAAGLANPVSGEGIYYALRSAQLLSRALLNSASYTTLMEADVAQLARQARISPMFFSPRFIAAGLGAARRFPGCEQRAVKFALRHFAGYEC